MYCVSFRAYGHENITGRHKTTLEITSEDFLTRRGTCIVGIRATQTLSMFDSSIKKLAGLETTKIILVLQTGEMIEQITGTGGPRLTYTDPVSMVARTSSYQCGRTLMINADKAASDLSDKFVSRLRDENAVLKCELRFIPQ
jgi:hypothetical protein